jgi:flagellar hook-length control protein FliK
LPGQAVAAAGTASEGTPGSFAEALAADPSTPTTTRRTQNGTPTEINAAAIGAANAGTVGQAQATDAVQTSSTTPAPVASQIADLAQTAARRPGQSVEMVLQPEGLGTVTVRVSVERAGLGVHIAVDNAQTREMVQASWPQLQQALDQRGLTVQSMLLDLSQGRSNGEAFQAFQQFAGQQRGSGQQQSRGGSSRSDRQGAVSTVGEVARPQPGVGSSSRVDYRI